MSGFDPLQTYAKRVKLDYGCEDLFPHVPRGIFLTFALFAAVGLVMFVARAPFELMKVLEVAYPVTWAVIWFCLWRRESGRSKG